MPVSISEGCKYVYSTETVDKDIEIQNRRKQSGKGKAAVPLHFASSSGVIGSSFGGAIVTGVFGSNLPAIVE